MSLLDGAKRATGTAIVIDVFRAFTTAAYAIEQGAEKIILVAGIEEALRLRENGTAHLCMGEVDGKRPDCFEFGNSPFAISNQNLQGKVVVQSTGAGTVGVTAANNADSIFLGSLVTATATIETILQDNPDKVSIVAMGAEGKSKTDEDEQCAMYLRNLLERRNPDPDALKSLILSGAESLKYDDPTRPHFDVRDRNLALDIDRFQFAISVRSINGLNVASKRT